MAQRLLLRAVADVLANVGYVHDFVGPDQSDKRFEQLSEEHPSTLLGRTTCVKARGAAR